MVMTDRIKTTNIRVRWAAGEDLHITPIAVKEGVRYPLQHNKVWYYNANEFAPYSHDRCLDYFWATGDISITRQVWYRTIKRFLVALWRTVSYHLHGIRWNKYFITDLIWHYQTGVPFTACEIYPTAIHVRGQLSVSDPSNLTDTYYLVPSQKYLRQRVAEWIRYTRTSVAKYSKKNPNWQTPDEDDDGNDFDYFATKCNLEDMQVFCSWYRQIRKHGYAVKFIAELDT